jgi:hypothetical protein
MTDEQSEKSGNGISVQEIILKTIGKAANSPAETVLKYIVIGIMTLFGVVVWYTWQSNMAQPEKLYTLLERSIEQQEKQAVAQTEALREIQRFTISVGIEHQDHATKLALHESTNAKRIDVLTSEIKTLCENNKLLVAAIHENTSIVSRWIEQLEKQEPQ